ncbi:hypothetical protein CAL7716_101330 (plasmid) [Calothrix sp. PCC 7716]|nr:hypothetical protein CAL7716_101330 [Calothrix sp. PCC 7716]
MANNTSQTSPTNQQVIELVKTEVEVQNNESTSNLPLTHQQGETIRANAWGYKEWSDS